MLSLCELRRAVRILESDFIGARIERAVEPGDGRLALALYTPPRRDDEEGGRKRVLMFSAAPSLARVGEAAQLPRAPSNPPAFVSYLRAHLSRARLVSVRLIGDDRQLALRFEAKEGEYDLVLSILGTRSNLYVVDAAGKVVAALRPPADTRPELALGNDFASPASGMPKLGEDRFAETSDPDYLIAIERAYSADESERETASLQRDIRQILKRERKNIQRRLDKLEAELAEADQATLLQRHGELLKTALGQIAPGAAAVDVQDYERDETVTIPLDPAKSPKENLNATFKRYQKLLRRLTKAGGQIDAARTWSQTLAELESELGRVADLGEAEQPEALAELAQRPELAPLLGKQRSAQSRRPGAEETPAPSLPARFKGLPRRLHPRRYVSQDGLEIWVGRSDEGNDLLTTRLARGNDLFFHLDGAPGSHVILRTEGRSDPPSESLLDACELAVHFSKQKNAGRADVHVVPIKQVKKPKGAKRGLVWVTGGRTVNLRRDEARLDRLMKSRIES